MRAVLISVEGMRLKFEWIEMYTSIPVVYYDPQCLSLIHGQKLLFPSREPNMLRFVGRDHIFCGQTYRIYVWDLLDPDSGELKTGLEEFLKTHFLPSTSNHEET